MSNRPEGYTFIVGGGMTGLTAGFLLARTGEKCVLLEREETVGGLCRSYTLDEIVFDLGPHVFFYDPDEEACRLLFHLLKGEHVVSRRFRFAIHTKNRFWQFPPSIFNMLLYPTRYQLELLSSHLMGKKKDILREPSLKTLIENTFGPSFYSDIFYQLTIKKTGIPGDQLHHDWQLRTGRDINNNKIKEIPGPVPKKSLKKIMSYLLGYQRYFYPTEGFETFPKKLQEEYTRAGGETILNCRDLSLQKEGDRITTISFQGTSYPAKNIIWTASINELNQLLQTAIRPFPYGNIVIVLLTYKTGKRVRRPFVYTYHPEKTYVFSRIYYPASLFREEGPADREGLCVEINEFGDLSNYSEAEIIARVVNDVERAGLFKKEDLRQSRLYWQKESLPIYPLDYENKIRETFRGVQSFKNLFSVGRMGGYFFCLLPAAVNQGLIIARHILQDKQERAFDVSLEF